MSVLPSDCVRVAAGVALLLVTLASQRHEAGAVNQSGPDGDNDGVYDVDEGPCGGDALNSSLRPERLDGPFRLVDDDGDTDVDELLPAGSENYDCDGDGWTGSQEALIFTASTTANDQDPCGNNGWPADLSGPTYDSKIDIADFGSFFFPLRPYGYPPEPHGNFNRFNPCAR